MIAGAEFRQLLSRADGGTRAAIMLLLWDMTGSSGPIPEWASEGRGRLRNAARAAAAAGAADMAAAFLRAAAE